MTNRYRAGADFERLVRSDLVTAGYEVIRSAGSKTKVDLVAFKQGQVLFVQVKRDGKIGPAERSELLRLSRLIGADPIVAWKHRGKRGIHYHRLLSSLPISVESWFPDAVASSLPEEQR